MRAPVGGGDAAALLLVVDDRLVQVLPQVAALLVRPRQLRGQGCSDDLELSGTAAAAPVRRETT